MDVALQRHDRSPRVTKKAETVARAKRPQEHQPRRHIRKALEMKVEDERQLHCDSCAVETNIENIVAPFSYPPSAHCTLTQVTVKSKKLIFSIHVEDGNDSCSPNARARLTRRAPSLHKAPSKRRNLIIIHYPYHSLPIPLSQTPVHLLQPLVSPASASSPSILFPISSKKPSV